MGSLPDLKSQIEIKEKELEELKAKLREICLHSNIHHQGYRNDGG